MSKIFAWIAALLLFAGIYSFVSWTGFSLDNLTPDEQAQIKAGRIEQVSTESPEKVNGAIRFISSLDENFQYTVLHDYIDFQWLGWTLFSLTALVYIISKEQWMRLKRQLQIHAMYDTLTNLPNRRLFTDRIQQAIKFCRREERKFSLIMADLDHFKTVNDTLGHHAGDDLLRQVTLRLKDVLRDSDTIARLGGDEFAIIIYCGDDEHFSLTSVAERLIQALEDPIYIEGLPFSVGVSLGIATFPDHGDDAETLMRRADISLYRSKEKRNCYTLYDKNTDEHTRDALRTVSDLRNAIRNKQLEVYYQPKIDCNTKQINGVEALARWIHPEKGFISPGVFIPLAKQNGLIRHLTVLVLQKAIRQAAEWYRNGYEIKLSVNITGENIEDLNFPDELSYLLKRFQMPPHLLELEITEDVIIKNIQKATQITERLREMGVAISIDDFGTGNSSISYLKKLPINTLKIDYSFIREMNNNPDDEAIVKTTILLSKSLGMSVVAEGVEDALTLDRLHSMGCDLAQGFYMCKPIPADLLNEWLITSPWGIQGAASQPGEPDSGTANR